MLLCYFSFLVTRILNSQVIFTLIPGNAHFFHTFFHLAIERQGERAPVIWTSTQCVSTPGRGTHCVDVNLTGVFSPSVAAAVVLWWSCTVGLSQPPDAVGTVVSCSGSAALGWASNRREESSTPHTHIPDGPPMAPCPICRDQILFQVSVGERVRGGGGCSHRHGHLRSPQSVSRPVPPGSHTLIKGLHSANRPGKSLHPALF